MRQLEDVQSWFNQPKTGTVETAVGPFWRLALHMKSDLKIVTIRRDPEEAARSAVNAGLSDDLEQTVKLFKYLDRKLDQIELRTKCKSYQFEDLVHEEVCANLFEHLLPHKHDSERWAELNAKNIQVDVAALNRYVTAYRPQLERLAAIARQKSLMLLGASSVTTGPELVLEFESFKNLLDTGQLAMKEHCLEVGENPDNYANKNLALLQSYDNAGALQITVAKSNGRIFGYLVTIIGESLESTGRLSGCHTAFYSSPDYPGIGLKLQRKAAEGLRNRGVSEVVMRAGIRGAGDRISTLYRRMGAEPFGTYYRLQLKEA
jgi:hypothetical protein